jgi:hypothetical protein
MFVGQLGHCSDGLFVENEVLQSCQRPVCIDRTTFAEYITITFVIVAWRAGVKKETILSGSARLEELIWSKLVQVEGRHTFSVFLASQMAKFGGFSVGQKAILQADFGAN